MLSEVSLVKKDKGHVFMWGIGHNTLQYMYNIMKTRLCLREVTNRRGRVKEGS
jgi:hypothetical protein